MNLIEFQGKQLLKRNNIPVPRHFFIRDPSMIETELQRLPYPAMLKSQVLTGQRGKNGGIRKADHYNDAVALARELINKPIKGFLPFGVLAEEMVDIDKELYFSITLNRREKCLTVMFSSYGGMNIEEIDPGMINRVNVNPLLGLRAYQIPRLFRNCGLEAEVRRKLQDMVMSLFRLCQTSHLELLEINPLVITHAGDLVALDAKITIDDNCRAMVEGSFDSVNGNQAIENPVEALTKSLGINGVRLGGDIAVMTSGAGVGMASIDTIQNSGGTIHSFVDLGGLIADEDAIARIIETMLSEAPKAFLINFFFQVGRCDIIARAAARAFRKHPGIPLVVRARGVNLEEAQILLNELGVKILDDFTLACDAVCASIRET